VVFFADESGLYCSYGNGNLRYIGACDQAQERRFRGRAGETIVRVIADAEQELVSREYLDHALQRELAPLRTELAVLKWMTGIVIGGVIALIIKTFLS
jgi:hypothetical protein